MLTGAQRPSSRGYGTYDKDSGTADEHSTADVTRTHDDEESVASKDVQTGVQKIEAISQAWTKWALVFAYLGIFLMAFCTSLEGQTVASLSVYATSAFAKHSLISTVLVIQGVVNSVVKPPMAKIADVFGRLEAFCISVFIYVIGYIQMAGSKNVQTYASAQIFYSAGSTGLQILQQVFIADTSDLLNRALFSSLPDIPFLITVWVGPPIAQSILPNWRWGYGLWTIVLPVTFMPLALALFLNQLKAKRLGFIRQRPWRGHKSSSIIQGIWYELDIMGLLLLSAAISLILIPLTLAATAKGRWRNASIIAMLVIGCLCVPAFLFWDTNKKLAPKPLLSLHLLRNRTVVAGCAIAFFYFMAFYFSVQPYFYSYLQVVQGLSVTAAGHVTQVFSFTSTVASISIGIIIKYTHHYKYFVTIGSAIYIMGLGIMIRYRTQGSTVGQIVGTQIAVGIGGGMLNVPAQLGVQASATHQEVAAATAIFLTILEIGGAVGSAISGAIWTANIPKKLALYLPPESQGDAVAIFGSLVTAQSYPMGTPTRDAINRAYQETMNILLIVAVCVAVPLLPLSLLMKNHKLDQMDQKVKGKVIGDSKRVDSISEAQTPASTGGGRWERSKLRSLLRR